MTTIFSSDSRFTRFSEGEILTFLAKHSKIARVCVQLTTIMPTYPDCFTPFQSDISSITLPLRFTYPFCYDPHPLSVIAALELQTHLTTQTQWTHPFGLDGQAPHSHGKMFGVLVVRHPQGQLGYLSAFSGQLAEQDHLPGFVPPVFDRFTEPTFFSDEASQISSINHQIIELTEATSRQTLIHKLDESHQAAEYAIAQQQQRMAENRTQRKRQRKEAEALQEPEQQALLAQLAQQSVYEKWQLKQLKLDWQKRINELSSQLDQLNGTIEALKQQRKQRSAQLQQKLFAHYRFLNQSGEEKNLNDIFVDATNPIPPAGAGECAAPKLLQYAFQHHLTPIALAEFWWGCSPKSDIRQHKQFYPACHSKCQPILAHMLAGMPLDENPLLNNPAEGKEMDILYQDEAIVVVNKPAEFLSVPGVNIKDSVQTRLEQIFPDVEGPFVLHRLDMSTSGLLVFALTRRANKSLQKQFITRQVEKQYVALLTGELSQQQGEITLPLCADLEDRPRQKVCEKQGKAAHTRWEKVAIENGQTRVNLYPLTGRTHQLRVHCAHVDGLAMPIVGDDLYGAKASRLCLHAQKLSFTHPYHKQRMTFEAPAHF